MKKLFLILFTVFISAFLNAQVLDPVKWSTSIEKKSETNYVLVLDAVIEKDWHMYSQFTPDGGPLPLELGFKNQKGNFELVGKASESNTKKAFNDIFGVDEIFFHDKGQLRQEIKLINKSTALIQVEVNYQVCKEVCINQKKNLSFKIPGGAIAIEEPAFAESGTITKNSDSVQQKEETAYQLEGSSKSVASTAAENKVLDQPKEHSKRSLWSIFFIAFFSGFAALLTPCVFPMIPMTVSFFTKQSRSKAEGIRNAVIYGISIILIYVLLGFVVTWIFGADALNALSTNVWFNILFFVLLVVFAVSFLGAFEIILPHSWVNKVDSRADKGGLIGILFMALALAIVSFSCTGPIVGTLLVDAATKGGIAPVMGMFGFSLALALPFMLFAMFPGWLHSLPKSGGWLNSVKVVLGFLELALAFKFLSNADLVLQLHLLEREVFLAIWIAIFGALVLYLFGKIKLPHDSPLTHISVGRLALGLVVASFTIYLIPGLWGAPLKLISAFPPPMEYSESPLGVGKTNEGSNATAILPEGAKFGPHQIVVFDDYDKGQAYAKTVNKPIMLDFTGHACVNCRKMENNVWSDKEVLPILKNEVVVISLYVDDKRELPKSEQYISKSTGNEIVTIGDKWTEFMISKYNTNTQPLYVITDLQGNNLNQKQPTISYVSVEKFKTWLKAGIGKF